MNLAVLSSDLTLSEIMDPIPGQCPCSPSNEETIFSPNFDHSDSQFRAINPFNSVRDESSELLHLIADVSGEGGNGNDPSSGDFHICGMLDFYLSENVSSFHFDSLMGFTSSDFSTAYHDWDMNMIMFDNFINNNNNTNNYNNSSSINIVDNDDEVHDADACLYLQTKPETESENGNGNGNVSCFSGDMEMIQCFEKQMIPGDLPDLMEIDLLPSSSNYNSNWVSKRDGSKNVTLVLDLDETLVHSTLDLCDDADFTFTVFFNNKEHTVYVRRRPYLQIFLERVAKLFEIVIFTASQSIYASQLLDRLDPDGVLFSRRVYRESCLFSEGSYTKDLTIFGVDLAKIAIVDNSPQVFRLQEDNGIPIKSWFDDPSDNALIQLLPFLETLADAEDVRPIISQKFSNNKELT